jgi:hypothetical protein
MKTRSQTKQVNIDFDESSNAWMANKIRRGPAMAYRCQAITKNGTQCTRPVLPIIQISDSPVCCTSHTKYGTPIQFAPWSGGSAGAESVGSPS